MKDDRILVNGLGRLSWKSDRLGYSFADDNTPMPAERQPDN